MKKLPIGIQTFKDIRTENYVYIDKTAIARQLIHQGRYYFLSRPRRFGKSLFLDTLKDIFEAKKSLFKGLDIYDQWDWKIAYPVIKISFSAGVHTDLEGLNKSILYLLKSNQKRLNIPCEDHYDAKTCFADLIEAAYEKYGKVVILIDEYDKPILDNITDKKTAKIMRDHLKNIYSVIKDNDAYLKFVFITGVSKFSKVNLFSGLNNLEDITIDARYATICGYTQHDLETSFKPHLKGVDKQQLKDWYNGYFYLGDKVYNPFDILLFIAKGGIFRAYWWSTGNPNFLIKLLQQNKYYIPTLTTLEVDDVLLDSFDVEQIDLVALLWQTGYLSIEKYRQGMFGALYQLKIPNREIRISLNRLFINYLTTQTIEVIPYQQSLYQSLKSADMQALEAVLQRLFASIPYNNFTNNTLQNYEGFYASVMYAYLASLGFELIAEDTTNRSRIDITLKLNHLIYLFEIKAVKQATGEALSQIKTRQYATKYQGLGNTVYCVGVEFCKQQRNICLFEWEKIS
jgi:hypothetical protein